jgi:hypothetical protein
MTILEIPFQFSRDHLASVAVARAADGDVFDERNILALRGEAADNARSDAGDNFLIFCGDFTNTVTHLGATSAELLTETPGGNLMLTGLGHDTLSGLGGNESLEDGGRDGRFMVHDFFFQRVDGGSIADTLPLSGRGLTQNLARIAETKLQPFEVLDFGCSANAPNSTALETRNLSFTGNTHHIADDNDASLPFDDPSGVIAVTSGGFTSLTKDGVNDPIVVVLGRDSLGRPLPPDPPPGNSPPTLASPLADQTAAEGKTLSFTIPTGSFTDPDNDSLTLFATLANGAALPSWLVFNPSMRTFSGTPPFDSSGNLTIRVTATDGDGAAAFDDFTLTIRADPDPFILTVVGGDWTDIDGDGDCDATGTILIGYKGGQTLLRVENAVAEYDEEGLRVASGMVYSAIRDLNGALFEGSFELDFDTGKVSVRDDPDNNGEHKLAAINYGIAGLTLKPRSIVVDIGPQLPDGLGGRVIGAESFPDLTIGANGLVLDRASVTLDFGFSLGEKWNVKSADLNFDYDGSKDKLKVDGEFAIATPFKGIPTGRSYIVQTVEGKPFTYGPDGVEGRIELLIQDLDFTAAGGQKGSRFGKFGLSEISAYIDFDDLEVGGRFNLNLPGFGKVKNPGIDASFGAVISPELKFNSFLLSLNGQVPLGPSGWFGQSVAFKGEHLAPNDQMPAQWSISGEVSYLPEFKLPLIGTEVGLLNISGTITGGADKWGASAQLKMLNLGSFSAIASTGYIEYDAVQSTLEIGGTKSIMNGFIETTDIFKVGFSPYYSLFADGNATLNFPTTDIWGLRLLSGKNLAGANYAISFTDDGNFSNDFVAGWTNISLPTFGIGSVVFKDHTIGLRFSFDNIMSPKLMDSTDIGMLSGARIATASQLALDEVTTFAAQRPGADFLLPSGAETVLFAATWDKPDPTAKLRLIAPDGTVYEENNFAAAGIAVIGALSNETGRAAGAAGLPGGTWRLEVVSVLDLGQIDFEAIAGEAAPELALGAIARDADGAVTIGYALADPDSNATLTLFATTDTPGTGGIVIGSGLSKTQAGNFVWNAAGVAPGVYTIYGVADDGAGAPVTALASGTVTVIGGTDLAIRLNPPASVASNQSFIVDVSVGNIGDGFATGTEIRLALPRGVEFLSSSAPAKITGQAVVIVIGDLVSGAERDFTVTLRAPSTPGAIELSARVSSNAFEQDLTDNLDSNNLSVIGGGNTLASSAGADMLAGSAGDDWASYALATGGVTVDLGAGSSSGGHGIDDLFSIEAVLGGSGADSLLGHGGSNTLSGGAGADTMAGGAGNDVFIVLDGSDLVLEYAGGGADTIITSVSMTAPVHVEALHIAAGISGITLTGGAGNDMLMGNGLANTFVGGAGDDVILVGTVTLADIYAQFAT